jgi:hypothetical protein
LSSQKNTEIEKLLIYTRKKYSMKTKHEIGGEVPWRAKRTSEAPPGDPSAKSNYISNNFV